MRTVTLYESYDGKRFLRKTDCLEYEQQMQDAKAANKMLRNGAYTWKGKPIAALSREELIEVVNWFSRELETLREDRNSWMKAVAQFNICFKKTSKER